MNTFKRICCLIALCALPVTALAANEDATGQIDFGFRGVNSNGSNAKFNEYRDLDDGAFGAVSLQAFRGGYYLDLGADNLGQDDQSFLLKGGRFGEFSYSLFYDETIHRFTDNALTYFTGIGSDELSDSGNSDDPALWSPFDYDLSRKNYGAEAGLSIWDPLAISFGASQTETDGLMAYGGSGAYELPAPIDWKDKRGFFATTYNQDALSVTLRGEMSEFNNNDDVVSWLGSKTSLAPDSDYWKMSGQLVWKAPVWDSTVAIRTSYAELSNSLYLGKSDPDAVVTDKFDGDISYTSFDAAYDAAPCENFDATLFVKYFERDNSNSKLDILGEENTPDAYDRTVYGFDGSYALPAQNTLDFGYKNVDVDREGRSDNSNSEDDVCYMQLRSRSFDDVELRAKYEHLERDGNADSPSKITDNNARSYDVTDQERDRIELAALAYVNDKLDIGVEAAWSESDYDDTTNGLTDLEHEEIYLTAGYALPEQIFASLYLGFEYDESKMSSESGEVYTQKTEFDTLAYGLSLEAPVGDRLTLSAIWNYADIDGKSKFDVDELENLSDVEDYTKQDLELECRYQFTEQLAMTLGYIYEKYRFDDDQWVGYDLNDPDVGALTGAYADQDYEANIGYLTASYSF